MAAHPPFEVRPPHGDEIVFRLVDNDEPPPEAFLSDAADGRRETLYRTQSVAIYKGFSVRATLPQAVKLAKTIGKQYVAEVVLSEQDGDSIAKTLKTPGHHTVWAEIDKIVTRVLQVHRVER